MSWHSCCKLYCLYVPNPWSDDEDLNMVVQAGLLTLQRSLGGSSNKSSYQKFLFCIVLKFISRNNVCFD